VAQAAIPTITDTILAAVKVMWLSRMRLGGMGGIRVGGCGFCGDEWDSGGSACHTDNDRSTI
jgi:hypothetical protein